jgi:hypothetical protein
VGPPHRHGPGAGPAAPRPGPVPLTGRGGERAAARLSEFAGNGAPGVTGQVPGGLSRDPAIARRLLCVRSPPHAGATVLEAAPAGHFGSRSSQQGPAGSRPGPGRKPEVGPKRPRAWPATPGPGRNRARR